MRLVIEFIITFVVLFGFLKLGWPWPILVIPAYLLAFAFKLPFLSRRTKISSRFLIFLVVFLTLAAFLSWLIAEALFQPEVGNGLIARSWLLSFLFSNNTLKIFWSVIIGLLIPALVAAIFLIPYGFTVGQNMYSQYEQYKGHEREAAFSAISVLLGIDHGTLIVSNGQTEVRGGASGILARFGWPGALIVQEGHAVILEVSGKLSRVVGRGITWLEPFERISMVVPLNTRMEKMVVEQVATRDRVLIDEFEVLVFHKLDPGSPDEQTQDGLFAYNEQKLMKDVWSPGAGDWRNTIRSISDGAVRDVVGRYDLEDLMPMSAQNRDKFKRELTQAICRTSLSVLGVGIPTVDIGRIKLPEEARKQLLEKWLADWSIRIAQSEREAMIRKGEAEAVVLKVKEVAWAQAQKQVIEEITAGFHGIDAAGKEAAYVFALRSLEALEKMAGDPATKVLLPQDMFVLLRELRHAIGNATLALPS